MELIYHVHKYSKLKNVGARTCARPYRICLILLYIAYPPKWLILPKIDFFKSLSSNVGLSSHALCQLMWGIETMYLGLLWINSIWRAHARAPLQNMPHIAIYSLPSKMAHFVKNRIFQNLVIKCRPKFSCARQMLLVQSSLRYIISTPHINWYSA